MTNHHHHQRIVSMPMMAIHVCARIQIAQSLRVFCCNLYHSRQVQWVIQITTKGQDIYKSRNNIKTMIWSMMGSYLSLTSTIKVTVPRWWRGGQGNSVSYSQYGPRVTVVSGQMKLYSQRQLQRTGVLTKEQWMYARDHGLWVKDFDKMQVQNNLMMHGWHGHSNQTLCSTLCCKNKSLTYIYIPSPPNELLCIAFTTSPPPRRLMFVVSQF